MNLHGIVSGVITAINPNQTVTIQLSTGYTTGPDGKRTPAYGSPFTATAQVQDLTQSELRQFDGLDIQGLMRSIYITGVLQGVVRFSRKGGDLLTLGDGTVWLTTSVLEQWPDWVKVSVTQQNGS